MSKGGIAMSNWELHHKALYTLNNKCFLTLTIFPSVSSPGIHIEGDITRKREKARESNEEKGKLYRQRM